MNTKIRYMVYSIDPQAYKSYKEQTRNGKDYSLELLKRRLTAFMFNPCKIVDHGFGSIIFKFGDFNIVVNYNGLSIALLYWGNERYRVSDKHQKSLSKTFEILGLSEDGKTIVKDEDLNALKKMFPNGPIVFPSNPQVIKREVRGGIYIPSEHKIETKSNPEGVQS